MLRIFPETSINVTYKLNKNLKKLIAPSLLRKAIKQNNCSNVLTYGMHTIEEDVVKRLNIFI